MEEKQRDLLSKCHVPLVKDLVPKKLFPHLIQEEVMTSDDKERINKIDKRKRQSEEFLSILPKRGPRAYQEFVKALEEKQPSLACILLREGRYIIPSPKMSLVYANFNHYYFKFKIVLTYEMPRSMTARFTQLLGNEPYMMAFNNEFNQQNLHFQFLTETR